MYFIPFCIDLEMALVAMVSLARPMGQVEFISRLDIANKLLLFSQYLGLTTTCTCSCE